MCLHITSLPGSQGIGTLGASARNFIDKLKRSGISLWQVLPLGPTGYGDSPYQPLSAFAGNTLLIDLEQLRDEGFLSTAEISGLEILPNDRVDFGSLIPRKTKLLQKAAARFDDIASDAMRTARDRFIHRHGANWLKDFVLFRTIKASQREAAWQEWPTALAQRDSASLSKFASEFHKQIECEKTLQFWFDSQWQSLLNYARQQEIKMMGDVPIYIALDSADAWARPELLDLDATGKPNFVAGVPPDYFSADGQLWGNPLYAWDKHADTNFAWWAARMSYALEQMDLLRLDHFRGYAGYWSIPANETTARQGEWLPGPGEHFFTTLREQIGALPVIAEDLGVITDDVVALRQAFDFPGMQVLQFLLEDPDFQPNQIRQNCACYTATHDNDTSLGWFLGGPEDSRNPEEIARIQALVLEKTDPAVFECNQKLIKLAFESSALLAIAPAQDYLGLGSEARLNKPGSTAANWTWRMQEGAWTKEICERISRLAQATNRCSDQVR